MTEKEKKTLQIGELKDSLSAVFAFKTGRQETQIKAQAQRNKREASIVLESPAFAVPAGNGCDQVQREGIAVGRQMAPLLVLKSSSCWKITMMASGPGQANVVFEAGKLDQILLWNCYVCSGALNLRKVQRALLHLLTYLPTIFSAQGKMGHCSVDINQTA